MVRKGGVSENAPPSGVPIQPPVVKTPGAPPARRYVSDVTLTPGLASPFVGGDLHISSIAATPSRGDDTSEPIPAPKTPPANPDAEPDAKPDAEPDAKPDAEPDANSDS